MRAGAPDATLRSVSTSHQPQRLIGAFALLALLLVIALLLASSAGATNVSWRAAMSGDDTARAIRIGIRLPRALLAALVGATLAVAGVNDLVAQLFENGAQHGGVQLVILGDQDAQVLRRRRGPNDRARIFAPESPYYWHPGVRRICRHVR